MRKFVCYQHNFLREKNKFSILVTFYKKIRSKYKTIMSYNEIHLYIKHDRKLLLNFVFFKEKKIKS